MQPAYFVAVNPLLLWLWSTVGAATLMRKAVVRLLRETRIGRFSDGQEGKEKGGQSLQYRGVLCLLLATNLRTIVSPNARRARGLSAPTPRHDTPHKFFFLLAFLVLSLVAVCRLFGLLCSVAGAWRRRSCCAGPCGC